MGTFVPNLISYVPTNLASVYRVAQKKKNDIWGVFFWTLRQNLVCSIVAQKKTTATKLVNIVSLEVLFLWFSVLNWRTPNSPPTHFGKRSRGKKNIRAGFFNIDFHFICGLMERSM